MTFSNDAAVRRRRCVAMMMGSREAVVDYMTPLGLHHLMDTRPSLRPRAVGRASVKRADWNSDLLPSRRRGRHRLRSRRRRAATPIAQYSPDGRERSSANRRKVPEKFLLWFHHVPWDYAGVVGPHALGRAGAALHARGRRGEPDAPTWAGSSRYVDAERFAQVAAFLAIQETGGAVVARRVHRLFPDVLEAAAAGRVSRRRAHPLEYYQALKFPYAPGR